MQQHDVVSRIPLIDLAAQQRRIRKALDAALAKVLAHGQYILGPEVGELEGQLAAFSGVRHAITCSSGTDGLLIALMALGVGPGDAVLCPAFTFPATPEAIALLGATPVFVDVELATCNIDPEAIDAGVDTARKVGLVTRAIVAADLFGLPADYDRIGRAAAVHDLWILADAAQSFGGSMRGRKVGQLALVTATSFFPAKPLGCYGDGGAIFTDDPVIADVLRSIRAHGRGKDKYDTVRIGINGRLDTLQAAILLEKLKIFPEEIARRNEVAERYRTALSEFVTVPTIPSDVIPVWAQYTVKLHASKRDSVANALEARGVATAVYYPRPLHWQDAYKHFPVSREGVPIAERLPTEVLSLPMHPYLAPDDQQHIVETIARALST